MKTLETFWGAFTHVGTYSSEEKHATCECGWHGSKRGSPRVGYREWCRHTEGRGRRLWR